MRVLKTQNENTARVTEANKTASYLHDLVYESPAGSRKTYSDYIW